MKKKRLRSLASDIADRLSADLKRLPERPAPGSEGIADELLREMVSQVVAAMYVSAELETKVSGPTDLERMTSEPVDVERRTSGPVDPGYQKRERKGVDLDSVNGDDGHKMHRARISFPNLKYAKPKYKNVESVLKYIEDSDDTGGIKLVIMNFND